MKNVKANLIISDNDITRFKEEAQAVGVTIEKQVQEKTMFGTEHRITLSTESPEKIYVIGKNMGLRSV